MGSLHDGWDWYLKECTVLVFGGVRGDGTVVIVCCYSRSRCHMLYSIRNQGSIVDKMDVRVVLVGPS